jgi:tetratricopeptide (TPR) repeat protein
MADEIKNLFKEKDKNMQQKEKWEESFEKAKSAVLKNNFDYALQILDHVVLLKPDLYEAHMLMRVCERRKADANPPSIITKTMLMAKLPKIISSATFAINKNKPLEAIQIYEQALHNNPYNGRLLILLADAMLGAGLIECAIGTCESILEFDRENVEALKKLGKLHSRKEDYKKARNYFLMADRLRPNDDSILVELKKIDAYATIQKGKWEDTSTFRTSIKDTEQTAQIEREEKVVRTESDVEQMIKYYEQSLAKDPDNPTTLRTLGDLYVRNKEYDKAINNYQEVLRIDKTNLAVMRKIGDVEIKKIESKLQVAEEKLKQNPDNPIILQEIVNIQKKIEEAKLKEAEKRSALYPTDPSIRLEYGILLLNNKNHDRAIAEFQAVVTDPARRTTALHMLGICFREKGMYDLAVAQFEKAIEKMTSLTEEKKEILYDLGITFEKMGKNQEAAEKFKKIFEVDINYRDVAKKIEEAYKKGYTG